MKILISIILIASLFQISTSQAATVNSAGEALKLCKAEAVKKYADHVSSKAKRIKTTRSGDYKIKMRLVLADSASNAECEVSKEGLVVYR